MTHKQILEAIGPTRETAGKFNVSIYDIGHWKVRGIPLKRWKQAVSIARSSGLDITVETLAVSYRPMVSA